MRDTNDRGGREERLEKPRVLVGHPGEPVEVEVRDRPVDALVGVADDEGRAGHWPADAERAQGAAHERRLAGSELSRDQHDVAGPEPGGEVGSGPLGRVRAGGRDGAAQG